MKPCNIELDDLPVQEEIPVSGIVRLQPTGFYLAGFVSLLCLPHPVVDTLVNLIYFFMKVNFL